MGLPLRLPANCCWPSPASALFCSALRQKKSKSNVTPDCRSGSLGAKHPTGTQAQIFIGQLRVCSRGAPSLTRGRVCRLQLLLVVASAVILGFESRETRSEINDTQLNIKGILHGVTSQWTVIITVTAVRVLNLTLTNNDTHSLDISRTNFHRDHGHLNQSRITGNPVRIFRPGHS
jgi:hypothetical protein